MKREVVDLLVRSDEVVWGRRVTCGHHCPGDCSGHSLKGEPGEPQEAAWTGTDGVALTAECSLRKEGRD